MKNILAILTLFTLVACNQQTQSTNNTTTNYNSSSTTQSYDTSYRRGSDMKFPILGAESESDKLKKNYYIVFDNSGSMGGSGCNGGGSKEEIAKNAVRAFVGSMTATSNVGMVVFDGDTSERVALTDTDKLTKIEQALKQTSNGGGTPLEEAMRIGVHKLAVQAGKQGGYGEYHLVVVTDGEADTHLDGVVDEIVSNTPVVIHTMGFCLNNHALNQPTKTVYKSADNYEALKKGLKEVLTEADSFQGSTAFDGMN